MWMLGWHNSIHNTCQSKWNKLSGGWPRKPGVRELIGSLCFPWCHKDTSLLFVSTGGVRICCSHSDLLHRPLFHPLEQQTVLDGKADRAHSHLILREQLVSKASDHQKHKEDQDISPKFPTAHGEYVHLVNMFIYERREGKIIPYFAFRWPDSDTAWVWIMFKEKLVCCSTFSIMSIQFN